MANAEPGSSSSLPSSSIASESSLTFPSSSIANVSVASVAVDCNSVVADLSPVLCLFEGPPNQLRPSYKALLTYL